jgi:hypothetical protein
MMEGTMGMRRELTDEQVSHIKSRGVPLKGLPRASMSLVEPRDRPVVADDQRRHVERLAFDIVWLGIGEATRRGGR